MARRAADAAIHELGRRTIEIILTLSAEQVAGARTPGKASGDVRWHGTQPGRVALGDRQLQVTRPRLRHKTDSEVAVPAYAALQYQPDAASHMIQALLNGLSTRQYETVLPAMAASVGVSKSAVRRQAVAASAGQLKALQERR